MYQMRGEIKRCMNGLQTILFEFWNSKFVLFAYGPIRSPRLNLIRVMSAWKITATISAAYCSFGYFLHEPLLKLSVGSNEVGSVVRTYCLRVASSSAKSSQSHNKGVSTQVTSQLQVSRTSGEAFQETTPSFLRASFSLSIHRTNFPLEIQNLWRTRASICSLSTSKCFSWRYWIRSLG